MSTGIKGDTAVALLKAGAETDKKDRDGFLALDLAPDKDVSFISRFVLNNFLLPVQSKESRSLIKD